MHSFYFFFLISFICKAGVPQRLICGQFFCQGHEDLSKVSKEGARGDGRSLLIIVNKGWRGLDLLSKYKAGIHNLNWRLVLAQAQIDPDCPTA